MYRQIIQPQQNVYGEPDETCILFHSAHVTRSRLKCLSPFIEVGAQLLNHSREHRYNFTVEQVPSQVRLAKEYVIQRRPA